ncbi:BMP family ABC transporter substrate-binding protein [Actinocrinis sp.]|uniref:BMP family lipoprotein n=1 Tax=Actinocrinis sp. TaxID=1920516 RepID=UPI002D3ACBE4|nr:BMP family ABC transporter substrate-binding protein [Actinocrinis sp.]HZP51540.1 BMP family ABC transporter substrate-binding protein [Actinocrinis sp.]
MVTDTGGIDDHSFNSAAWAGMQKAQSDGKATVSYVQSATENQYTTNIASLVGKGCKLVVTVGGLMADATTASAKTHTGQNYTIVDSSSVSPNVKGLEFNTAQGAFLGGYLAAGYSKSGKVATFGGLNIAPVTVYMDGFWEGVQYYNSKHGTHVQVLGWNETTQQGSFAQSFTDQNAGKQLAAGFMSQGADIVFPVAGGTGLGALAEAQQSNGGLNAIWVDTDGFTAAPQYASVLITSVLKGISDAVTKAVEDASSGNFSETAYVGTLANGGTGLAPYHDFDGKIPASLTSELDTVKQGIISGTITIKSKNQPKS